MIVDISVACGAGTAADPIPNTLCMYSVVNPTTTPDVMTPMIRPTCWYTGVAPTM
jgi:hypothetical protein